VRRYRAGRQTTLQPSRQAIERDDLIDLHARTHQRPLRIVHQHFGHERTRVVGAGLHRPVGARAHHGQEITRLSGDALDAIRRRYGVVFQGGALFDSMRCADNVAFPLREKVRLPKAEIAKRVDSALAQVGLEGVGQKYPAEVSGGMRKRVAIARALVIEPEIVFFDEPTTGLDPVLVNTIHHLILDLHRRHRFTAVMVSHEIPEIFEIADRVAMLHEGRIVEVGPPAQLQASQNRVVQKFIRGEPEGT